MITLTEKELQDLMKFIEEIPTKYGIPLVQFFNEKVEQSKVKPDEQGEN